MNYSLAFTLLSLIAGFLSLTLVMGTLKASKGSDNNVAILLFSSLSFYCFGYALELQNFALPITLQIIGIEYIGITLSPVLLLLFIFRYQGIRKETIHTFFPFLFLIPVVTLIIVWTPLIIPWLYEKAWMNTSSLVPGFSMSPGIWWYVITIWNFCLLIIGLIFLGMNLFSRGAVYRKQTALMIVGVLAPFFSFFLNNYLRNIFPVDVTPFTLVITGLALYPAITRMNLLSIVPVAYATVFKTLASGLLVLDNQSLIREINSAAEDIFQISRQDVLGKEVSILNPLRRVFDNPLKLSESRKEIKFSLEGKTEYYLLDVMPFHDVDNVQAGSVLMFTRITDRKESEEQLVEYNAIIEKRNAELQTAYQKLEKNQNALRDSENSLKKAQSIARLGAYEWNQLSDKVYVSDEFLSIFGRNEIKDPSSISEFISQVTSSDREKVSSVLSDLEQTEAPFTIEFWIELENTVKRAIRGQGEVEHNEDGSPHYIFIIQDITERKLMEEKIHEAYLEKETLLREIHHRVKNNMQVISSLLSIQSRAIDEPSIQDMFKQTQGKIRSLSLVHELLYQSDNLNKIDYYTYIQKITRYFLQSYETLQGMVTYTIDMEKIDLSIEKAVPCSLILSELLTNSFKYAFPEGIKGEISIRFFFNDKENEYTLEYRDNGRGFTASKVKHEDPGIGFSLIEGLTRQLSGRVWVDTSESGVHYVITFPGDRRT